MTSDYYTPQREERTSYGIRRVGPYMRLFEDRIIFLGAPISGDIANAVMTQLLCLQSMDAERQISIYTNSLGDSFTALTVIYGTICYIKPDIQTVRLGQVASAAALLLAADTKGKCLALPNSHILIHQSAMEGGYGQSSDLGIQIKEIMYIRELMENMLAADTGQTVMKVSRDIERDKYLTAQEAVKYGVVDSVLISLKNVGVWILGLVRVLRHGMTPR